MAPGSALANIWVYICSRMRKLFQPGNSRPYKICSGLYSRHDTHRYAGPVYPKTKGITLEQLQQKLGIN